MALSSTDVRGIYAHRPFDASPWGTVGQASPSSKNLILDQRLIDRARLLLDAPTETEAITRALAVAIDVETFRRDLGTAARMMYGKGRFEHLDGAGGLDFSGLVSPAAYPASRRR